MKSGNEKSSDGPTITLRQFGKENSLEERQLTTDAPPERILYLHAITQAIRVEARINDIPVLQFDDLQRSSSFVPIREYITEGRNRLDVIIEPPHVGARTLPMPRPLKEGAFARIRVAEFADGEFMGFDSGTGFAEILEEPPLAAVGPLVRTAYFNATPARTWSWCKAPAAPWEQHQLLLHTFMDIVTRLFAERNGAALTALMDPCLRDDAYAYPAISYEKRVESMVRKHSKPISDFRPIPFNSQRAVFRPVADGRMIQPLDIKGLPLVRSEFATNDPIDDPSYRAVPMMIGIRDKRLAILRT